MYVNVEEYFQMIWSGLSNLVRDVNTSSCYILFKDGLSTERRYTRSRRKIQFQLWFHLVPFTPQFIGWNPLKWSNTFRTFPRLVFRRHCEYFPKKRWKEVVSKCRNEGSLSYSLNFRSILFIHKNFIKVFFLFFFSRLWHFEKSNEPKTKETKKVSWIPFFYLAQRSLKKGEKGAEGLSRKQDRFDCWIEVSFEMRKNPSE